MRMAQLAQAKERPPMSISFISQIFSLLQRTVIQVYTCPLCTMNTLVFSHTHSMLSKIHFVRDSRMHSRESVWNAFYNRVF